MRKLGPGLLLLVTALVGYLFVQQLQLNRTQNQQAQLLSGALSTNKSALNKDDFEKLELASRLAGALPVVGADGKPTTCGDGQVLSFSNGKVICASLSASADGTIAVTTLGAPSSDGAAGVGSKTESGTSGKDGAAGKDGTDGQNGSDGRDGVDGSNGVNGTSGRDGVDGTDGQNGANGLDASAANKGDKGDKGDTGATGAAGNNGTNGTDGIDGTNGRDGVDGTDGRSGTDGAPGAKGDTGAAGVVSVTPTQTISGSIAGQILSLNVTTDPNGGLIASNSGLGLTAACTNGQILKYDGTSWNCAGDNNTQVATADITAAAGGPITITGGQDAVLNPVSISIATASSTQTGLLTSADWSTFSNKENALTFNGNGMFSRTGNAISAQSTCTTDQILKYDGTTWVCATDADTVYTAGTGLNLTGTIFSLADTGTAGSYGNATSIPVITTNAQGQITGVTSTAIAGLTSANLAASAGITNSQLINPNVNVTTGSGLSGGGTVQLGGTITLTNSGLLSLTTAAGPLSASTGQNPSLSIAQANGSTDGYLTAADYTSFINKQTALTFGDLKSGNAGVVSVTNGAGKVVGGDATVTIATAATGQSGLLTAGDWTSFTNKENALTFNGNGIFSRTGNTISSTICTTGQILKYNGTTWACATDDGTTYTADDTGSNTNTPISITGTKIGFSDGTAVGQYWTWDGTKWILSNQTNGITVGALDGQAKNTNGATIAGGVLYLQSADETNPGVVTTGTQTLAGNKTLTGNTTLGDNFSDVLTMVGRQVSLPNGLNTVTAPGQNVAISTGTTGALTLDSGTTGNISIGTSSNGKQITIGNQFGNTGITFNTGQSVFAVNSAAIGAQTASRISADQVTTGEVYQIIADALSSGNGLRVSSASTNFTGNLAKFGLTDLDGSAANTGTAVSIDTGAAANSNVLPLNIARASAGQLVGYNNGTATTGYYNGIGSPEGVVIANVGSTYSATDTGSMYVKTSNSGGTSGWTVLGAGVAASYYQAGRTTIQNTSINVGDPTLFNGAPTTGGSDIQYNNGKFNLKAGRTYKITGSVGVGDFSTNTGEVKMQWRVVSGPNTGLIGTEQKTLAINNNNTNQNGNGLAEAILTPPKDTIIQFEITGKNSLLSLGNGNALPYAFIQVIGGNSPVVGQTTDFAFAKLSSDQSSNTSAGSDHIKFNALLAGNIQLDTTSAYTSATNANSVGRFMLKAGKTYSLEGGANTDVKPGNLQLQWRNADTGTQLQASNTSKQDSDLASGPTVASAIYSPSSDTRVELFISGSNGGTVLSSNSYAKITQLGTTASTGIAMNSLADALANGALDNKGYTQTWNWNTLGANNGLVINSDDIATTGSLFNVTNASAGGSVNGLARFNFTGDHTGNGVQIDDSSKAGIALSVITNNLTSGNGLKISSSSNAMTGSLAYIDLGGNDTANTGNLLRLNSSGTNNNASGLLINVAGSGFALDVSGKLALRPSSSDYTGSGTQDNIVLPGNASSYIIAPATGNLTIKGIVPGANPNGRVISLINPSGYTVTINDQASSTNANKIVTGTGSDVVIRQGGGALLQYETRANVWRIIGAPTQPAGAEQNSMMELTAAIQNGVAASTLSSGDGYTVKYDYSPNTVGSNISLNGSTNTITLQPGRTYSLSANIGSLGMTVTSSSGSDAVNAATETRWFNASSNTPLGQSCSVYVPLYGNKLTARGMTGPCQTTVTVTGSPMQVQFKLGPTAFSSASSYDVGYKLSSGRDSNPTALITQVR